MLQNVQAGDCLRSHKLLGATTLLGGLAVGAEMTAALTNHNALDSSSTMQTIIALPPIYLQKFLVAALFPIRINEIPNGGSVVLQSALQDSEDGVKKPLLLTLAKG